MRPPSQQLAEAAEAAGEHTHDIDLRSEAHKRAERVLGKAVHPGAVGRLYELWPTAKVFVRHTTVELTPEEAFKGGTHRVATEVWIVKYPDDPDSPRASGTAVKHPNDGWDRKRGIELAFRRALDTVRWQAVEAAPKPSHATLAEGMLSHATLAEGMPSHATLAEGTP